MCLYVHTIVKQIAGIKNSSRVQFNTLLCIKLTVQHFTPNGYFSSKSYDTYLKYLLLLQTAQAMLIYVNIKTLAVVLGES